MSDRSSILHVNIRGPVLLLDCQLLLLRSCCCSCLVSHDAQVKAARHEVEKHHSNCAYHNYCRSINRAHLRVLAVSMPQPTIILIWPCKAAEANSKPRADKSTSAMSPHIILLTRKVSLSPPTIVRGDGLYTNEVPSILNAIAVCALDFVAAAKAAAGPGLFLHRPEQCFPASLIYIHMIHQSLFSSEIVNFWTHEDISAVHVPERCTQLLTRAGSYQYTRS